MRGIRRAVAGIFSQHARDPITHPRPLATSKRSPGHITTSLYMRTQNLATQLERETDAEFARSARTITTIMNEICYMKGVNFTTFTFSLEGFGGPETTLGPTY
jgi:hypothetical protein